MTTTPAAPPSSSSNPRVKEHIKENQSLREQLKKAQAEIERLRRALEEALRSLKRQAAPFSKEWGRGHGVGVYLRYHDYLKIK